jgi:hypothetical protein
VEVAVVLRELSEEEARAALEGGELPPQPRLWISGHGADLHDAQLTLEIGGVMLSGVLQWHGNEQFMLTEITGA